MSKPKSTNETSKDDPKAKKEEEPKAPLLCSGSCGFYGSPDFNGYCSQCYKKLNINKNNNNNNNNINNNKDNDNNINKNDESKNNNDKNIDNNNNKNIEIKKDEKKKKKKNRCIQCRKKLTLAGRYECKCGNTYCSMHRYPDAHDCSHDHKEDHKKKLAQMNPEIKFAKLNKIE